MPSRARLEELVALAQSYRDLTRREVAERLGRDPHNLIPDTGNPKLDFVVKLGQLLDWSVEMVVQELYAGGPTGAIDDLTASEARERNRQAWELVRAERWEEAIAVLRMVIDGPAPREAKAYAYQLLVTACESQGRYLEALDAARCGLTQSSPGSPEALRLRGLLAFSHYITGAPYEAEGIAGALLADLEAMPGELERGDPLRQTQGFAHFVRGQARRCIAIAEDQVDLRLAAKAVADLERAIALCEDFAVRGTVAWDAGLADIARAGIFEIRALSGELAIEEAMRDALGRLEGTERIDELDSTAAEALGWWCVFAANVALRRLAAGDERDRLMGILTNKADEVATRLGHWALRERVLVLEHRASEGSARGDDLNPRGGRLEETGLSEPNRAESLDSEDLRAVAGTMSRFPEFRPIGWRILRSRRAAEGGGEP